MLYMINC